MPKFTTSDGLSLYYTDDGDGLPILCLSGLTRTSKDFSYVTPHLSGTRLIKLDYRGRGNSDWDTNWANYNLLIEARDVIELLDHLALDRVAILGTSRGGLLAMGLAFGAKERLLGAALNDIGPVIEPKGLDNIMGYIGRAPKAVSHLTAARLLEQNMTGFSDVPLTRWMEEAIKHYTRSGSGLDITYDPKLRDAVELQGAQAAPDLWPYFDALSGLPLACIRGENSDLFSHETLKEMKNRRPEMISATVIGRGHVPFLDEPESVAALQTWVEALK
ncbi:alpha/beta fold hydrolase [Roseobacter litoralis]|uniref:Alpha/beta hydrolase-like protein n=1 Tax=Roseobacter litoralis (strain ATCC 49566 / DSM 6996 / JCM 21268 / NBRC 15278 / OCh 149) TaxID=391595 RepID=F7ZIL2_ROSLO|nr:alpha/beta hydrolase [Roseobacter litoralis]AEI92531.1 alpha/beta hydrolase-like protein [Roseobacter litoralis Och 149]